jgi:hypothetical protein
MWGCERIGLAQEKGCLQEEYNKEKAKVVFKVQNIYSKPLRALKTSFQKAAYVMYLYCMF